MKTGTKKLEIIFEKSTNTIRQIPENYLLAQRNSGPKWVCEPDLAADKEVCVRLFLVLMEHENKYGTGEKVLEAYDKACDNELLRME